ncbi:hypothetical protein AVEN_132555-1 [Araneus ventricosus]|uniref:Uncharacterized protein n=1 Tax=Araneus ventricosus TaxID=182803 RepID=A0A4Y2LAJ1_ARAVE|nr:hypothetical protein AVEN_132555-1 [Araneus ventricosus]
MLSACLDVVRFGLKSLIEKSLYRLESWCGAKFGERSASLEELTVLGGVDISELEAELNVLKVKVERLEITHASILGLLSEEEFEVVGDYRDKAIRTETKARRIITYQQPNTRTVLHSTHSDSAVIYSAENAVIEKRRKNKKWLYFWSQFEKIHVDSSIEDSDKFQYLLQSTVKGSRARKEIESFPSTGDNYPKAIDYLKTRFGRHDLQVEIYARELLKLVLKNANSDFCSNNLRALYDNLEQQILAPETLCVTTDKSAALLYPLVESCMPEDFLRAWQRSFNFHLGSDSKKRLNSLLKFNKTEVESEERINLAMTGFGLKDETAYKNGSKINKDKMCTEASLLRTFATVEKLCVFCNIKHESIN